MLPPQPEVPTAECTAIPSRYEPHVEHGATEDVFLSPENTETSDYIEGRYG